MASKSVRTQRSSAKVKLAGGSLFACSCGSKEFRVIEDGTHLFCRCGQVYTNKDFPPLEES